MSYYEMDPDVVYDAGGSLADLSTHAGSVAVAALRGYSEAGGAVGHPVLSAAWFSFADQHSTLHHSIGPAVAGLGSALGMSSNAVTDGQNESTHVQKAGAADAEHDLQGQRPTL